MQSWVMLHGSSGVLAACLHMCCTAGKPAPLGSSCITVGTKLHTRRAHVRPGPHSAPLLTTTTAGAVELELTDVQPMIDSARKAVGQIKSDNITEIRSLKSPPDAIRDVLEGVLLVMGQQDLSWASMKKFLGSMRVKEEIINFDARRVTQELRSKVGGSGRGALCGCACCTQLYVVVAAVTAMNLTPAGASTWCRCLLNLLATSLIHLLTR